MASLWDKLKDLLARGARALTGDQAGGEDEFFRDPKSWRAVSSSNLHSVAYYVDLRRGGRGNVLGVRFLRKGTSGWGSEYRYQNVSLAEFSSLLAASSKGHELHVAIKKAGKPYRKVK